MTGKNLRASLLAGSMALMGLGISLLSAPSTEGHMNHIIGAFFMMVAAIVAFVREQVKEEQLTKVFVQKKDMDDVHKPPL